MLWKGQESTAGAVGRAFMCADSAASRVQTLRRGINTMIRVQNLRQY